MVEGDKNVTGGIDAPRHDKVLRTCKFKVSGNKRTHHAAGQHWSWQCIMLQTMVTGLPNAAGSLEQPGLRSGGSAPYCHVHAA